MAKALLQHKNLYSMRVSMRTPSGCLTHYTVHAVETSTREVKRRMNIKMYKLLGTRFLGIDKITEKDIVYA